MKRWTLLALVAALAVGCGGAPAPSVPQAPFGGGGGAASPQTAAPPGQGAQAVTTPVGGSQFDDGTIALVFPAGWQVSRQPAQNRPELLAIAVSPDNQTMYMVGVMPYPVSGAIGKAEADTISTNILRGLLSEQLAYGNDVEISRYGAKPGIFGRALGYSDDFDVKNRNGQGTGFGRIYMIESKPSVYLITGISGTAAEVARAGDAIASTLRFR